MSKLKSLTFDEYKVAAKATLNEAADEEPDAVIVLMFHRGTGQFKIKCSKVENRLELVGALEEAKNHVWVRIMSTFQMKTTEVTIEMDGLHITTVTAPDHKPNETRDPDEAQIGDFHMSLFTLDEWVEFSGLIEKAIREVTK